MFQTIESFLKGTSIGQQWLMEQAAEQRKTRLALVEERRALLARKKQLIDAHDATIEPLRKRADAARQKAADADRAHATAISAYCSSVDALTREVGQLDGKLRQSADARITEARTALVSRWEREQRSLMRSEEIPQAGKIGAPPIYRSNRAAVAKLAAAIAAARVAFDGLLLEEPADLDVAIAAVLAPVERAWVEIGIMAEVGQ